MLITRLICVFLLITLLVRAQKSYVLEGEKEVEFIALDTTWLAFSKRKDTLLIAELDQSLNQVFKTSVVVEANDYFYKTRIQHQKLFGTVRRGEKIHRYEYESGQFTWENNMEFPFRIDDLIQGKDYSMVTSGKKLFVLLPSQGTFKELEVPSALMSSIFYHESDQSFYLALLLENHDIQLRRWSELKGEFQDWRIQTGGKFTFQSIDVSKGIGNQIVIDGTYSKGNVRGSNGFYIAALEGEGWKFVKLLDFDKFDSFFRTSANNIQLQKIKSQGKKEFDAQVSLIKRPLLMGDSCYFLLAEVYEQRYSNQMFIDYSFGYPIQQSRMVNDGFKITHSIWCGVTMDGQKFTDFNREVNLNVQRIMPVYQVMDDRKTVVFNHDRKIWRLNDNDWLENSFEEKLDIFNEPYSIQRLNWKTNRNGDLFYQSNVVFKEKGMLLGKNQVRFSAYEMAK